ncbi:hypothetical protein JKF63_00202 [Porcisia hertigi]|uniref:Streptococcal hemagglutinin-like protein n=1 Tax=Porcisia hertigi TaxID=2761500 RepID=A0A836HYM7_9TRYP|nr:hypothetical protein JKF63_00202 [Porcisia hertigi]
MNAKPVCGCGPFSTDGVINTSERSDSDNGTLPPALRRISSDAGGSGSGVTALVSPRPPAPSPRSAQTPSHSSSGRAAQERKAVVDGAAAARRRSGVAGYASSGERRVCISRIPAAVTNDVDTNASNASAIVDPQLWMGGNDTHTTCEAADTDGGANAAACEETNDKSPFVSRSTSASSGSGCAGWSTVAHVSQSASAMHRDRNGASAGRPDLCPPLAQDNRGFLNPGYSYDSSESLSDGSAGRIDRQRAPSGAPPSQAAPAVTLSEKARENGGVVSPSLAATNSSGGGRPPTLDLFPLTPIEEQAACQAYATYTAKQQKACHQRSLSSNVQQRRRSSAFASSTSLSALTSAGVHELLRLLRGLYHRAHIMMTFTTKARESVSAPSQRKAGTQSMSANVAHVQYTAPSPEQLLDLAEACFGTRRFQALMAAVAADREASTLISLQSDARSRPVVSTVSQSRSSSSSSSSQGLTLEEALSFMSHVKFKRASVAPRQGRRKQAGLPVKPIAVARYKEQDHPVKVVLAQPSHALEAVQMVRSTSARNRRVDHRVSRFPCVQALRRSCRPPASPIAWMTTRRVRSACSSSSREEMSKALVMVAPRKPTERRRGSRKSTALRSSSSCPSSSNSCIHDAAYEDDHIRTYVQRKAFAEIAENQGCRDSATVTLGRLAEVLGGFELVLNPSVVERVCGTLLAQVREPRHVPIDFSAFATIIDSGLQCRRYDETSGSSSAFASASAYNNGELPEAMALLLRPESSVRHSAVMPLISSRTVTDAALLTTGDGAAPYAQAASYTDTLRCGEVSSQSPLAATVTAAAYHPLNSMSSAASTAASSPASGASAHRSFETDDAYPLVTHGSAIAVLCRSIRQRLRRELRRGVNGGPDTLRSPQDSQLIDSSSEGRAPRRGGEESQHSPLARTSLTASHSFRSSSPTSTAAMSVFSKDMSAVVLGDEFTFALCDSQDFSTTSQLSKQANVAKCKTQIFRQWPHEPASPSPLVARALFDHSNLYALKPTPRARCSQRDSSCGRDAIALRRFRTAQHRSAHGQQKNGPPPANAAPAEKQIHFSAVARPSRQYQRAMDLLTSLSPYYTPSQVTQRSTRRQRSLSTDGIALSLFSKSSSLHSRGNESVLHGPPSAASNSSTASVSQSFLAQSTSRPPQWNRPASALARSAVPPRPVVYATRMPHPPFAPSTRSSSRPWSTGASSDKLGRHRIRSQ